MKIAGDSLFYAGKHTALILAMMIKEQNDLPSMKEVDSKWGISPINVPAEGRNF